MAVNRGAFPRILLACFAFLLLLPFAASSSSAATEPAPGFELFDLDGYPVRLSDFTSKGRPVLLDFMATWCSSCHFTIKEMKKAHVGYSDRITILSIATDLTESEQSLREYRAEYNMSWQMARDTDKVTQKYSVIAISYLVAINAKGYAVWTKQGEATEADVRQGFELATRPDAPPINIVQIGIFAMAILAGVASFFSPCAFPMLPGYVSYYLGLEAKRFGPTLPGTAVPATRAPDAATRGAKGGLAAGLGILTIYGLIGGIVVVLAGSITPYVPLLGPAVGALLIAFGIMMLAGLSMMRVFGPLAAKLQGQQPGSAGASQPIGLEGATQGIPYRRLFTYGAAYGAAACGCVAPIMLGIIFLGIASGPLVGLVLVLLYAGAAAALMIVVTMGIAVSGPALARKLNKYMPWINRASAVALVVVGIYLIVFWYLAWIA